MVGVAATSVLQDTNYTPQLPWSSQAPVPPGGNYVNAPIGTNPTALNPQQQFSLGQWGMDNVVNPVKDFLGFNNQTPQLMIPGTIGPDNQVITPKMANANNLALQTQAQQSLAKWSAIGNTIQGVSGLANAYIGLEQLDLAKDSAKFTKQAYETNLRNQTRDYNTQLQERRKRYLERSGTYSDDALNSYMNEHGL